jgi:hypothetical protein
LNVAFAVCLMIGVAAMEIIRGRHELEVVRTARAAHASHVAQAMRDEARLDSLSNRLDVVREIGARAPYRTRAIVDLATHLPLNSHVESMRLIGDTIEAVGVTKDPSGMLEALRSGMGAARFTAPLTIIEDGVGSHRFTMRVKTGAGS